MGKDDRNLTSLLIHGGLVWQDGAFRRGVDVWIKGNRIAEVGSGLEAPGAQRIDASGHLVLPGFVNAHTHAAMTLLRSYADDLPLQVWLEEHIWPVEANLEPEDVYWGTMLAIAEMIRAGITTFADMYFFMDEVGKAVEQTGIRAVLASSVFDGPSASEQLEEARRLAERWHGAGDGRIAVALGPHSPYACYENLKVVGEQARELGITVHIHLAETRKELEEIRQRHGLTPVGVVERAGLFEGPVVAAHCVHLEDGDFDILQRHGVRVAHNPSANMKLGSGRAPVQRMLEHGITVALGTDGPSSNNNLDLLEEARIASFLAKMEGETSALPAATCLQMATENGAKALGFPDVGRIAPGMQADIILVNTDAPHWKPLFDPVANLIYSAHSRDVSTVIVAGRVLMEKGRLLTIDEEEVMAKASERARALVARRR